LKKEREIKNCLFPAVDCPWIPWKVAWKVFPWSIGTEFHGKTEGGREIVHGLHHLLTWTLSMDSMDTVCSFHKSVHGQNRSGPWTQ